MHLGNLFYIIPKYQLKLTQKITQTCTFSLWAGGPEKIQMYLNTNDNRSTFLNQILKIKLKKKLKYKKNS